MRSSTVSRRHGVATLVGLALVVGVLVPAPGWSQEDQPSQTETLEESAEVPDGPPDGFVPGVDDVPQAGEEILGHTPFTRSWRKTDGSIGFESFVHQRFFESAEGVWREVDPTLVVSADSLVGRALPDGSPRLATTVDADVDAVRLGEPLREVSVRYPGVVAATDAVVDEVADVARYPDAYGPGASLVLDLSAAGWKDSVELDEQATLSGYDVRLTVPVGTTAHEPAGGGIEVTDPTGKRLLAYGAGAVAFDSATPSAESPVVVTLVKQTPTAVVVRVQADQAWLQAPERVFPVTIDPIGNYDWRLTGGSECSTSPSTFTPCDTYGNSDAPNGALWQQTELRIGSPGGQEAGQPAGTNNRTRTFVKFPTDNYGTGSHIYTVKSGMISLYAYEAGSTTTYTDHLYEMMSSPTSATTWNNQPSWGDHEASVAVGGLGYRQWYPTPLVNRWFRGTQTNHGVGIQTCCDERSTARFKKFHSNQAWGVTNTTSSRQPRMYVQYYNYPSNPGTPAVTAGSGSVTATWTASSDNGGGTIEYEVQVRSGSTCQTPREVRTAGA